MGEYPEYFGSVTVTHQIKQFIEEAPERLRNFKEFQELKDRASKVSSFTNDLLGKQILIGFFGEQIAIAFRNWVRERIAKAQREMEVSAA